MTDSLSRRDLLKAAGALGAGSLLRPAADVLASGQGPAPEIQALTSTSDVFVPGRGRAFHKFSFDFPEPSVEVGGYRFGFMVFTHDNAYGLDIGRIKVEAAESGVTLGCDGFVWAGGQEKAEGRLTARFVLRNGWLEWDVTAEMERPIKAVTTVVRGLPRGRISAAGGPLFDPKDDEVLYGYPFGAGDLFGGNTAWGINTPLLAIEVGERDCRFLASLDDRVRAKRFYLQPGEHGYRVEAVFEAEGWNPSRRVQVPTWRLGRTERLDDAVAVHYGHLERAYRLTPWDKRNDVPPWLRETSLVLALHGMHYSGYVFNDFARMLEILRWVGARIEPAKVLVFLPAWDGRYYWDYPVYRPAPRLGGDEGFRRLIGEGHQLGFHFMPMFGANTANRTHPEFARFADAGTERIDGDRFDLTWVDWDNDRHQEGWVAYLNLGVESWRRWLTERIAETVQRYQVDAYFLDIVAGWINNPQADMHEGTVRLVSELRGRYPAVLACGEFHYDALLEVIPLYHVYASSTRRYARSFEHLSHPAPGRGSTGVHESGFERWDAATASVRTGPIPTLTVVDDTFARHRDQMEAVIRRARERVPG